MLHVPMVRGGILAIGVAIALGGQALASDRGSPEDQLACTPDVYRFCSSQVPDEDAIVACLNRNVNGLTPACRKVMTRPADTPGKAQQDEDTD